MISPEILFLPSLLSDRTEQAVTARLHPEPGTSFDPSSSQQGKVCRWTVGLGHVGRPTALSSEGPCAGCVTLSCHCLSVLNRSCTEAFCFCVAQGHGLGSWPRRNRLLSQFYKWREWCSEPQATLLEISWDKLSNSGFLPSFHWWSPTITLSLCGNSAPWPLCYCPGGEGESRFSSLTGKAWPP